MKCILLALFALVAFAHAAENRRLVISKKSDVVVLLEDEQPILIAPIARGAEDSTPTGRYSVAVTNRHDKSNKWSQKLGFEIPMSDCLRLTGKGKGNSNIPAQEGVCFHESFIGSNLEKAYSHGCIRADRATADWVYCKAYIGMRVDVVELFEGPLAQFDKFDRNKIELRGNVWPSLPNPEVAAVLRRLNEKGGGNKAGRHVEYPIDLNALAVILGSQLVTKGLTDKGSLFGDIDPAVKAYISRLPAKTSGASKWSFVQSDGARKPGMVGYLIKGGNFFLWYPLEQINEVLVKMGLNPLR